MTTEATGLTADSGFFSLMDLATANTDDIATVLSRLPAPGVYVCKVESVAGSQGEPSDDGKPGLISFKYVYEALDVKPIDKKVDPLTLVGRKLSENYVLWPSDFEGLLGLLKGRHQKANLPNTGALGGVEGAPPGWLDSSVGNIVTLRVFSFMSKGQERVGFEWIGGEPKAAEAAAG